MLQIIQSFCLFLMILIGPVFVELPIDSLYKYDLVKKELGATGSKGGFLARIVNL